jgi:cellulose biosynthesis protein BcsQ
MKTLAIISQKGGVGKITLATALAVAAGKDGKIVAVFDLIPRLRPLSGRIPARPIPRPSWRSPLPASSMF